MTSPLDAETRLDRVESRFAIMELAAAYCMACDDRDNATLRTLFTADAEFRSKDGVMRSAGVEDILKMYAGRFAALGVTYHWTHDHTIRFDDADRNRATGLVCGHAECYRNGQTLVAGMRYDDVYKRDGGKWRFASRTIGFLYYVPVHEYAEALSGRLRQRAYGDKRAADYPENMPTWVEGAHLPGT